MKNKLITLSWILTSILLFLYSFTQVDLNLTLSRIPIWQPIEKFFQQIGYFNRPLSTFIFLLIVLFLFYLYLLTLKAVKEGKIKRNEIWKIILIVSAILFLSYNAFSYDLFNYIFDARIITHYHENPYLHKALDFKGDPMLSFMRWTHRVYPYGPFWLVLTVPFSFLGLGLFLPTLYLFKAIAVLSFLGTAYFIEKILEKTKVLDSVLGLSFFAFNPLIIIESLVSAHNDIAMIFFAVLSLYLLFERKYFFSSLNIIVSIAIKFATAFMLPTYLIIIYFKKNKHKEIFHLLLILMILPIVFATIRTTFQPWYLLYFLTFAAFLSNKYYIFIPSLILSLVGLLNYIPFLYLGDWNEPVPTILVNMNIIAIIISIFVIFILFLSKKRTFNLLKSINLNFINEKIN